MVRRAHGRTPAIGTDSTPRDHILLIDDNREIVDLLREILNDEGFRVSVAYAPLPPAEVAALAPDLIIQELLFGGKSEAGWSDLEPGQMDPESARIPRILCTTSSERVQEPAMAAHLERLGIRVLLKPFAIGELLAAVTGAFAARQPGERTQPRPDDRPTPARASMPGDSGQYAAFPG